MAQAQVAPIARHPYADGTLKKMLIDGKWVAAASGKTFESRNPATGELLAQAIIKLMQQTGMPNGLKAVGYAPEDVDKLVTGTIVQHRVTKLSPRPANEAELKDMFLDSMTLW